MGGTNGATAAPKVRRRTGVGVLAPLLWGGLATAGFYVLLHFLPVERERALRYFCSHPLEYATTTLFFVGLATLALKALRLPGERAAFARDLLGNSEPAPTLSDDQRAERIHRRLNELPTSAAQTQLVHRVRELCSYVTSRRSTEGLDEHLKYLADLAAERLHASYALVRTITWAVPILGFLGTVIGITLAIANVTPEQLDTSLGEVTSGLAVAFDTTALALTLSMVLVFASFLVERGEQSILTRVEEFGIEHIAPLFSSPSDRNPGPLALAEQQAALKLLDRTETLIQQQTELWRNNLEALRTRWTETLDAQQQELDEALKRGISSALEDHAGQLQAVRGEFLEAFQSATQAFAEQVGLLQQTGDATREHTAEVRRLSETIAGLVEGEQQLVRLEARLAENLEAIHSGETFEQTLHNLTAAVHLLTARNKPKAA